MKNTVTYIEFFQPGIYEAQRTCEKVEARAESTKLPQNCYAYRFFDRTEMEVDGELLIGPSKNFSGMTFFGKAMYAEEFMQSRHSSPQAIKAIKARGWKRVAVCAMGRAFPMEDADRAVEAK